MMWGLLGSAMLLFLPFLADPYMTPRLIVPAIMAAGLLLLGKHKGSTLTGAALVFLAAASISAFFAQDKGHALIGSYQFPMDSGMAFAVYFGVLLAAARSDLSVDDVSEMIVKLSVIISLYAIAQKLVPDPFLVLGLPHGRAVSTQGGPVYLGAVLCISALCALDRLSKRMDNDSLWAFLLAVIGMMLAQTRGALIGFAVGAFFIAEKKRPALILGGVALLGCLPRLLSYKSDMARLEILNIGWRAFMENPLTGYGIGNFQLAFRRYVSWDFVEIYQNATSIQSHAHFDLLHVAATMGIIGVAAYLYLAARTIREARENFMEYRLLTALLAAYAVFSSLNPVTGTVYIMLAAIFGAATDDGEAHGRFLPASLAVVCLLVAGMTARLTLADWHVMQGVKHDKADVMKSAQHFNRAAQLNPFEMIWTCKQVDSLLSLIPATTMSHAQNMAAMGRRVAGAAVARHPMDSYAHELYGKTIIMGMMVGLPGDAKQALDEFNRAQALAPTFEKLMWRRKAVAGHIKSQPDLQKADADIETLRQALSKRG